MEVDNLLADAEKLTGGKVTVEGSARISAATGAARFS